MNDIIIIIISSSNSSSSSSSSSSSNSIYDGGIITGELVTGEFISKIIQYLNLFSDSFLEVLVTIVMYTVKPVTDIHLK